MMFFLSVLSCTEQLVQKEALYKFSNTIRCLLDHMISRDSPAFIAQFLSLVTLFLSSALLVGIFFH